MSTVVIGGGVIGLAVARELAMRGRSVTLLEAEAGLGEHTSSRGSAVIHAGLYYAPGSLKARTCVEGKALLYRYAEEHGIAHRRIGKLVVATSEAELAGLQSIFDNAAQCGVSDLSWLDARELRTLEPQVRAVRALFSPSTGIIDSRALLLALQRDAIRHGAEILTQRRVVSGAQRPHGLELEVEAVGGQRSQIACRELVNAAGLWAQAVARSIDGILGTSIPELCLAKGQFFNLEGDSPFSHLVYPLPEPGGLGIHFTLDLAGHAKFGPDVQWVHRIDYSFDSSRRESFEAAIRRYYPALRPGALVPGVTGVRPKLSGPGEPAADFSLQGAGEHGVPGLLNLYGIESPGLTASLALARLVADRLNAASAA